MRTLQRMRWDTARTHWKHLSFLALAMKVTQHLQERYLVSDGKNILAARARCAFRGARAY